MYARKRIVQQGLQIDCVNTKTYLVLFLHQRYDYIFDYQSINLKKNEIKSIKREQLLKSSVRERSQHLLLECSNQIKRRFPDLLSEFSLLDDPRRRKDYSLEEILMGGLSLFLFKQGSRNSINNKRREESFSTTYAHHFGLRLPHQDSICEVLSNMPAEKLDQVKMDLMSGLFDQKCLRDYRLFDMYYLVAVDATGVVSFDTPHCEHCLTKKSKNGKITYFHYVLEAKLVTPDGHCLSLGSEWIENPEGDFDKQDCEQKAFVRLAAKLKKQYPRLPICFLADGLYPNNTVFNICEANKFKYIFVLQDKSLKSVQKDVLLTKQKAPVRTSYVVKNKQRIARQFRFQTGIEYKKQSIHWFGCTETRSKDIPAGQKSEKEPTVHHFEYVTNLEPTCDNVIELAAAGRLRWKVENEGFNTQKCGDYELEHKYCRKSLNALKNYYTLLQIAHAINQFIEKSTLVVGLLKEHSKETLRNIWSNLVAYMLLTDDYIKLISPNPT